MEGLPFHGGKLDDISIIVARAVLDDEQVIYGSGV